MKESLQRLWGMVARRREARALRALMRTPSIFAERPRLLQPERGKIAVLAPHMDDEVLGCGGTLVRHANAGAEVSVIFLTDGRRGGTGNWQTIVEVRKAEAQRACQALGVSHVHFLGAQDGRLKGDSTVHTRLRVLLEKERPNIVYLPSFFENHVDHRAVGEILILASSGCRHDVECRSYEVWTPLLPNTVVDIDAVLEVKTRALQCYASQLALMDYAHTSRGLNAFRSSALGGETARFAEAFHVLPLPDYRRLHHSIRRFL